MKNTTSEPTEKRIEIEVDLDGLGDLYNDLRSKVGSVRENDRYQLAHQMKVSDWELRKFQTPGMQPSFELLLAMIAFYYPGMILATGRELQKDTGGRVDPPPMYCA